MVSSKKIANNILDFLIDPTRVPVKERVYFRDGRYSGMNHMKRPKRMRVRPLKTRSTTLTFIRKKTVH